MATTARLDSIAGASRRHACRWRSRRSMRWFERGRPALCPFCDQMGRRQSPRGSAGEHHTQGLNYRSSSTHGIEKSSGETNHSATRSVGRHQRYLVLAAGRLRGADDDRTPLCAVRSRPLTTRLTPADDAGPCGRPVAAPGLMPTPLGRPRRRPRPLLRKPRDHHYLPLTVPPAGSQVSRPETAPQIGGAT